MKEESGGIEQRILNISEEMFFKYGVKSITMDDIAKQLGVSKKTIYNNYKDKDHLLQTLVMRQITRNREEMQCCFEKAENAIHEIMLSMKHLGEVFSKINPVTFYDMFKYHHESWMMFKNFKDEHISQIVENNLARGIKEKLYRSDINVKILARLRIEELEMAINGNVFKTDEYSLLEVQLELLKHFLLGICTLKGHKLVNQYLNITESEN